MVNIKRRKLQAFKVKSQKLRTIYAANILAGRYNIKGNTFAHGMINELTRSATTAKGSYNRLYDEHTAVIGRRKRTMTRALNILQ